MPDIKINIPKIFLPLFRKPQRYNILYGGRGGGKSWAVAIFCLVKAMEGRKRILCTREIQRTIKDSVYKLLSDIIQTNDIMSKFYTIKNDSIIGINGSEFIFKGLRHNPQEIKSTEGIDICWVEEAQSISKQSHDILTPTIRKPGSIIIYTYNPYSKKDVIYTEFIEKQRDNSLLIQALYKDNPYLPDVLKEEAEYDFKNDYLLYKHKWLGEILQQSNLYVFRDKIYVDEYDYTNNSPIIRYGADWGFSADATAVVKVVVDIDNNILYIEQEAYALHCDIDKLPVLFSEIEGIHKGLIIADSSRPDTIAYMRNKGFAIRGSIKGAKSVYDGIMFLRSFEKIIIHPNCKNAIEEFTNYKYKADKITGEPLNDVQDGNDHTIDATRYAIEDLMRMTKTNVNIRALQKVRRSETQKLPI